MSNLNRAVRHKRYSVRESCGLNLIVETKMADRLEGHVVNCSLTGLKALFDAKECESIQQDIGEIFPAAKLSSGSETDFTLGRLVLRSLEVKGDSAYLAFSLVDNKLPLEGEISKYLNIGINDPLETELSPKKFNLASFAENHVPSRDLFAKCRTFKKYYDEWKESDKFQYYIVRKPGKGIRVKLNQKRDDGRRDFLVTGSYDYLGLATHPEVLEAASKAIDTYGLSSTGTPVLTGLTEIHEELCDFISKLYGKERTLVFNSGFAANIAAMQCLSNSGDLVLADILSHRSISDGLVLSKGTTRYFKHNDMKHLRSILKDIRDNYDGCLIVSEGVFSMDGDVGVIDELTQVAREFDCRLFIDETHSIGVIGEHNLGAVDYFDVIDQTDIIMSSLSKVCGAAGGFITGDREVMDWINYYGNSYLFSATLSPSAAAAALTSLKIMHNNPDLVAGLSENIKYFTNGLRRLGIQLPHDHISPIIPVVIGDEEKLGVMNRFMMSKGIYAIPIVYPAVSRKLSRFRFTITSTMTLTDIDFIITTLESAFRVADWTPPDK